MNGSNAYIKKAPFMKRFVYPTSIVLITWIVSTFVYWNSSKVGSAGLHYLLADASGILMFLSIGFGSILIYPMAYFRGASTAERIAASLVTPIIWIIKEEIRVSEFFTLGKTLYYALNQLHVMVILGSFGLMAACEIACRMIVRKRTGNQIKIVTAFPVSAMVIALIAFYCSLLWEGGVHWFYFFVRVYRAIFL